MDKRKFEKIRSVYEQRLRTAVDTMADPAMVSVTDTLSAVSMSGSTSGASLIADSKSRSDDCGGGPFGFQTKCDL